MSQSHTPLADWLIEACETRGLSWAEASRQAGLYQGAISAIVRGTQPGLEICKGLAAFFGVPLEDVLSMAGHLTPNRTRTWPPELLALVQEVERLPLPMQRAAIRAWRAVLDGIAAGRTPE
jgi:hypothetical protein